MQERLAIGANAVVASDRYQIDADRGGTVQERLASGAKAEVTVDGEAYTITPDLVTITQLTKKVSGRNFVPSVIEPSFGIGRILYCLFEHSFYQRPQSESEGENQPPRNVFAFSPLIAPTKTTVFPLLQRADLNDVAQKISLELRSGGLSNLIDTTGAAPSLVVFSFTCPGLSFGADPVLVLGGVCPLRTVLVLRPT